MPGKINKLVCPSCGKEIPHRGGDTCPLVKCPVCGKRMICK